VKSGGSVLGEGQDDYKSGDSYLQLRFERTLNHGIGFEISRIRD
jgi:hypothetical protein